MAIPSSAYTPAQLRRLTAYWISIAHEPLNVEYIGGCLYGFTSELGAYRLERQYRYSSPRSRAIYSESCKTWVFCLEPGFDRPVPSDSDIDYIVAWDKAHLPSAQGGDPRAPQEILHLSALIQILCQRNLYLEDCVRLQQAPTRFELVAVVAHVLKRQPE